MHAERKPARIRIGVLALGARHHVVRQAIEVDAAVRMDRPEDLRARPEADVRVGGDGVFRERRDGELDLDLFGKIRIGADFAGRSDGDDGRAGLRRDDIQDELADDVAGRVLVRMRIRSGAAGTVLVIDRGMRQVPAVIFDARLCDFRGLFPVQGLAADLDLIDGPSGQAADEDGGDDAERQDLEQDLSFGCAERAIHRLSLRLRIEAWAVALTGPGARRGSRSTVRLSLMRRTFRTFTGCDKGGVVPS